MVLLAVTVIRGNSHGTTMTVSLYMGNDTVPMDSSGYVRSNNFGMQLNFSVPLDGGMIEQCGALLNVMKKKCV